MVAYMRPALREGTGSMRTQAQLSSAQHYACERKDSVYSNHWRPREKAMFGLTTAGPAGCPDRQQCRPVILHLWQLWSIPEKLVISYHKSSLLMLSKGGFIEIVFFIHLFIDYINFHTVVEKVSANCREHMAFKVKQTYHSQSKKNNHVYRHPYNSISQ